MVLWEITLGTAYFLGLKRTYKLALRIQRRLVGPRHPKIRHFLQRKTRSIFDIALKVHREVQQRDIEVGRNLGNWILRWLDKMKPSAHIRVAKPKPHDDAVNPKPHDDAVNPTKQQLTDKSHQKPPRHYGVSYKDKESGKRHFTSGTAIMTRPMQQFGIYTHNRHFNTFELKSTRFGVVRNDIMQWMIQN